MLAVPVFLPTPMHKQATLTLAEPTRKQAVASLRAYSAEHFDDGLSELQASLILDHVLSDLGPAIYNQAAADARAYVEERAAAMRSIGGAGTDAQRNHCDRSEVP